MTIVSQEYIMPAGGGGTVFDPALAYVTLLVVKREGLGHNQAATSTVGNREYYHYTRSGLIEFEDATDILLNEQKALIIYKY